MEAELFFHILGAMVLVGSLILAVVAIAGGRGSAAGLRLGLRALLLGAIPGWIVMRVFAQTLAGDIPEEFTPSWIDIGYMVAEPGLLFLIGAAVATGLASRRVGASAAGGTVAAAPLASRVAVALIGISLVAYLVVIWAMTTKPA